MESIIQLDNVYIYIDDIVICGNTPEEVLKKTKEVINKITSENFRVNEEKSFLLSQELKLLGRVVSHQTVKPDVEKLMGFDFSAPVTCGKDLQKILGFSLFFSEFVPGYANYTQNLNTFQTKRKVNDADVREDIRKLQYALYHSTSLSEFELDQTRAKTILATDASRSAILGVLYQYVEQLVHIKELEEDLERKMYKYLVCDLQKSPDDFSIQKSSDVSNYIKEKLRSLGNNSHNSNTTSNRLGLGLPVPQEGETSGQGDYILGERDLSGFTTMKVKCY
jgi:hypothetical protein